MQICKKMTTAALMSSLIASFIFLFPGAGTGLAAGHMRHLNSAGGQGYQHNAAHHQGRQVSRRVTTTTRYFVPRSVKQRHAAGACRSGGFRHQRAGERFAARNSFKRQHKPRRHNPRTRQHLNHTPGLFAVLPGIILNIPL